MSLETVSVFFYGSYMDRETLERWKVKPIAFDVSRLADWDITFCPFATLIPSRGRSVYGIMAKVTRDEVARLYAREELADYKEIQIVAETSSMNLIPAVTYVCNPTDDMKPSRTYLELLISTAKKQGFPATYIERLNSFR